MPHPTHILNSKRRKRRRNQDSNPIGVGLLVSSILISHPSWGRGAAGVHAAPSHPSSNPNVDTISTRKERSSRSSFSKESEELERRRGSFKGKEKETDGYRNQQMQGSIILDEIDDHLSSSHSNSPSESLSFNSNSKSKSRSDLFNSGSRSDSDREDDINRNRQLPSSSYSSSSFKLLNKRSTSNSTNLLLATATATPATPITQVLLNSRLAAASGYSSGLASTWSPPERSVWFEKRAIIIISIFLAIFIVLIIGAAVFLRDRNNDELFLGLDDDEDEEVAIERMVQERLRKSFNSKKRRQKAWCIISGILSFKGKGNQRDGSSTNAGAEDEKSGENSLNEDREGSGGLVGNGDEDGRDEDDRGGLNRGSGSSSSRNGSNSNLNSNQNELRERRPTESSGSNPSSNRNSSSGNHPNNNSRSLANQNNSSPTKMKVTQELKDKERLAQNSMMGKWRLRRRRRAAVGAAALAAEEEEDFSNRIRDHLRVRNDSDERLASNGSDENDSNRLNETNGSENRRTSNDSARRPESTRSNGRDNRIVNASRWIRVPVIGSSPNSPTRRNARRSAAAASRIDAPEGSNNQSRSNSNGQSSEEVALNDASNSIENTDSIDSDRLEGSGSNRGQSSSSNRLDASDLSAAEIVHNSGESESTALPPAYIASRSNRSNLNRSNQIDDSPSESRRNSLDGRIAPPPPHPQHINFTRPRAGESSQGTSHEASSSSDRIGISASEEKEALRRARAQEEGEIEGGNGNLDSDEFATAIDLINRNDQLPLDFDETTSSGPSNFSSLPAHHGAHVATDDKAVLGALAAGRSAPTRGSHHAVEESAPSEGSQFDHDLDSSVPSYAPARPSAPEDLENDGMEVEEDSPPDSDGLEQSSRSQGSNSQSRQVFTSTNEKSRDLYNSASSPSSSRPDHSSNLPEPPKSLNTTFDHTAIERIKSRGQDDDETGVYSPFDQPYQPIWPPSKGSGRNKDISPSERPGSTSQIHPENLNSDQTLPSAPSAPPLDEGEDQNQDSTSTSNPTNSTSHQSSDTNILKSEREEISRLNRRKEKQREAGNLDQEYLESENDGGSILLDQNGIPLNLLPNSPNSLLPSYPIDSTSSASKTSPSAPQEEDKVDDENEIEIEIDANSIPNSRILPSAPDQEDLMLEQLEREIEEEDRRS